MKQTPKQVINNHKKILAKMVQSFLFKSVGETPEKILALYEAFSKDWDRRVRSVNERQGKAVLSYDVWEREMKGNGYLKVITIPIPKQLPEAEKEKLRAYKKELVRIIFIIEGKSEHQRSRRETFYKIIFLKIRFIAWVKSLFAKKEVAPLKCK